MYQNLIERLFDNIKDIRTNTQSFFFFNVWKVFSNTKVQFPGLGIYWVSTLVPNLKVIWTPITIAVDKLSEFLIGFSLQLRIGDSFGSSD